jgi:F-type H+-transporting ATPase subunit delta
LADDFQGHEVAERYSRALFDLALQDKALEAVSADLEGLRGSLAQSPDLRRLINSPAFTSEDKGKALVAVAMQLGAHMLTLKFLGLLAENRRAAALPAVMTAYRRLYDEHRGVISAEVTTALKLTAAQQKGVAAALAQALGREPEIRTVVDPAILGGIKVKVGSRLYDASLKTKLDSLKFALKRA